MFETVVCGVDESDGAVAAARVASDLAAASGARLVLVHARETLVVPGAAAIPHAHADLRALALAEAERVLHAVASRGACEHAELRVELGEPAQCLAAVARELAPALLVVGSRGRGAIRSVLFGSVSASLVHESPAPVVVVPPLAVAA